MIDERDPVADAAGEEVTTPEQQAQHEANALALRTAAMVELDPIEAGITDLETKYAGAVFDVTTTQGMADAKAARAAIRAPRYAAENVRKDKTGQLSKLAKEINARATSIKERILKIEEPIHAQIDAEESRKEAEREKARAEAAAALQAQQEGLAAIAAVPGRLFGASVVELDAAIQRLNDWDMAAFDDVFLPTAEDARKDALATLTTARDARAALDAQAEALRAQQAQLEAQQRSLAEQQEQAERDRVAREQADAAARAAEQAGLEEIQAIASVPVGLIGATSAEIKAAIDTTTAIDTSHSKFGTRRVEADAAKVKVLGQLATMLADTEARELQAAENAERQRQLDAQEEQRQREAEAERQRNANLLADIDGIRQYAVAAAECQTIADIETLLAAANALPVQQDHFGQFYEAAHAAKEQAVTVIEGILAVAQEKAKAAEVAAEQAAELAKWDAVAMLIDMPDGSRWGVPLMAIVRHRAAFIVSNNPDTTVEAEVVREVGADFFKENAWAADWAANDMDWTDVAGVAFQYKPAESVDYQEGWVNGKKSFITRQG